MQEICVIKQSDIIINKEIYGIKDVVCRLSCMIEEDWKNL